MVLHISSAIGLIFEQAPSSLPSMSSTLSASLSKRLSAFLSFPVQLFKVSPAVVGFSKSSSASICYFSSINSSRISTSSLSSASTWRSSYSISDFYSFGDSAVEHEPHLKRDSDYKAGEFVVSFSVVTSPVVVIFYNSSGLGVIFYSSSCS